MAAWYRVGIGFSLWLFALTAGKIVSGQEVKFTLINEQEGLSHNSVFDLTGDRWGFIWIGTRYGLNRFDGYRCQLFEPHPDSMLQSQWIYALYADTSGRIWTAYRDGGLWIFDPGTEQLTRFQPPLPFAHDWRKVTIRKIMRDSRGWLWLATNGEGVWVFDEKDQFSFRLGYDNGNRLASLFPVDFAEDAEGNIWIATSGKGIHLWNAASGTTAHIQDTRPGAPDLDSFGKVLQIDKQQRVWVGTGGKGLYRYEPKQGRFIPFALSPQHAGHELVTGMDIDELGHLWVSTDGDGLFRLDSAGRVLSAWTSDPGSSENLCSNALYNIFQDRKGNFWVGTFNRGVQLISPQNGLVRNVTPRGSPFSSGASSVLALTAADESHLWIGTDGGGLGLMDLANGETRFFTPENSPLPGQVITSLTPEGDGGWWIGTFTRGLSLFYPASGRIQTFRNEEQNPASLGSNNVWDLDKGPDGGLWIATMGGGMSFLPRPDAPFSRLTPMSGEAIALSDWLTVDVLIARNGTIWVATETQGLCRFDPAAQRMRRYRYSGLSQDKLTTNFLRCLFEDNKGQIWIGSEGKGLFCLDPVTEEIRHYSRSGGLPSDLIDAIQQDQQGNMWVSTPGGLARLVPETGDIRIFAPEGGQPSPQYNPRAALRLPDGSLVFGHTQGVSIIHPSRIHYPPGPEVAFTGFRVFNQRILGGKYVDRSLWKGPLNDSTTRIRISYLENQFSFDFSALEPAVARGMKYAYRLGGFQDEWQMAGPDERTAAYTNLTPGTYQFEVKAAYPYGDWGQPRSISIEITPPYWQTWWFRTLVWVLALAAAGAVPVYFLQQQRIRSRRQMLDAERKILKLKNEKLAQEAHARQERLTALLLQTAHRNEFLQGIREEIENGSTEKVLKQKLLGAIKQELSEPDYWEKFQLSFDESHQEFTRTLRSRHEGLSKSEVRLACLIHLNLANKEMASVLNISLSGVEKGKFRLKQRMGLPRETDLTQYLVDFLRK